MLRTWSWSTERGTCHVLWALCNELCELEGGAGWGTGPGLLTLPSHPDGLEPGTSQLPVAKKLQPLLSPCADSEKKARVLPAKMKPSSCSLSLSTFPCCCEEEVGGGLQKPGVTVLQNKLRVLPPHRGEKRAEGQPPPRSTSGHGISRGSQPGPWDVGTGEPNPRGIQG